MILFLVEHMFCMKSFKTAREVPRGVWEGCLGGERGGSGSFSAVQELCNSYVEKKKKERGKLFYNSAEAPAGRNGGSL